MMKNYPLSYQAVDKETEAESHYILSQHNSNGYTVGAPPKSSATEDFTHTFREFFFHDDPLYQYKDKSKKRQCWLVLQNFFPILEWARHYTLKMFKGDLIAGLTIASLCIPQDIGYAKLANVDAHYGLYTSVVPPIIYAFMGSSRDVVIGPVAVVSLLLAELLRREFDPEKNKEEYLRLAFTATFFAGITQATLGSLRLGFIVEYLSHAAVVGFTAGAAITIGLQQLKGLFGIKNFTRNTDIISVIHSVFTNVQHGWNWQTMLIGAIFLAYLVTTKYVAIKNPKIYWLAASAPLISVVVSTFFVFITHAENDGVQIVSRIHKGLNPSSLNEIYWSGPNLKKGARIGFMAGMVGLTEAIAIGRTFAAIKDYQLDGNKEMLASGVMNIAGSFSSCIVATGSFSRSAVNFMSGCYTPLPNIVMSLIALLFLVVITPLFKYTPNSVISAIIINAIIGLVDFRSAFKIYKVDKVDFLACLGAFLGVIFKSVEVGLLISVILSIAKILLQVTRPKILLLGNLPKTTTFRNVEQYTEAIRIPGVLILKVESAIYFANATYVREKILRWLRDEEDLNRQYMKDRTQHLILEMSAVTDIDTSGIRELEELFKILKRLYIQLELVNPGPLVMDKLLLANFIDLLREEHLFVTVGDAVAHCFAKSSKPPEDVCV
ncbi:sulfate transporter 1.2-like [Carex rostrata]